MILALLNLLGAEQPNYASCRYYINLRVEIGQDAYIFTSSTYNIYLSNNKKADFSKLVFRQAGGAEAAGGENFCDTILNPASNFYAR